MSALKAAVTVPSKAIRTIAGAIDGKKKAKRGGSPALGDLKHAAILALVLSVAYADLLLNLISNSYGKRH